MKKFIKSSKAFTLIELLVVIAVLGILATGVLIAIDPVDKLNAANDSKSQTDIASIANATEAYAVSKSGFYPAGPYATAMNTLVGNGDLKITPVAPSGYTYTFDSSPSSCIAGSTCASVVITGTLKSKKYVGTSTSVQRYESSTGKTCQVATATTSCP